MNYMQFMTDADTGAKGFGVYCTTPDGLYTVRVWFLHSRQNAQATANNNTESIVSAYNNVQLRNNSDETKTLMWNYEIAYGGHISNAGGNLQVPPKVFGGAESGNSWVSNSPTTNARWGDPGIYNAVNSGPEYRRYSWIDTSTTTKVAYTVSVMAGMDPQAVNTDISKQKVFIKIEQITAM